MNIANRFIYFRDKYTNMSLSKMMAFLTPYFILCTFFEMICELLGIFSSVHGAGAQLLVGMIIGAISMGIMLTIGKPISDKIERWLDGEN